MRRILVLIQILLITDASADNIVKIDQISSGNYNVFDISIIGYNDKIEFSFRGSNNSFDIIQEGNNSYVGYTEIWGPGAQWGGDLDGDYNSLLVRQLCNLSPCGGDRIEFHISGDHNEVSAYQGYGSNANGTVTYDSIEYGGHFMQLDIHGSNNILLLSQRSNTIGHEHIIISSIFGNDNNIYMRQDSNNGKYMNLTINNNNNDVDMIQTGHGAAHVATVTINGSYPTVLYMQQKGATAQNYSLNQDCQSVGGCSLSVTQGQ